MVISKSQTKSKMLDEGLRIYIIKVYNHMCLALTLTAIAAMIAISFDSIASLLFVSDHTGELVGLTGIGMVILFVPLIISIYMSFKFQTLSPDESRALLWAYSICIGFSLAPIGLIYTGASIARTFFICAAVFGAMSIYGYVTKRDLTSIGSFLMMGLFGLIITSVINMFMQSEAIYYTQSLIGILIFMGLISWDTQKIKMIYYNAPDKETKDKLAVMAALALYLDILNLFLYLLRFFGVKKEKKH